MIYGSERPKLKIGDTPDPKCPQAAGEMLMHLRAQLVALELRAHTDKQRIAIAAGRTSASRREVIALAEQAERAQAQAEVVQSRLTEQVSALQDQVARLSNDLKTLQEKKDALRLQVESLQRQLDAVVGSTVWRASWVFRMLAGRAPSSVRQAIRVCTKRIW